MAGVLLRHGDEICGFPAVQASYAARTVDARQWCSVGVVARELRISSPEARAGSSEFSAVGRCDR
jgi:hypothetical protein